VVIFPGRVAFNGNFEPTTPSPASSSLSAFTLEFDFFAESDDKEAEIAQEITYYDKDNIDKELFDYTFDAEGVHYPFGPGSSFTEKKVEALRFIVDEYLPERAVQIQDLEKWVEVIKEALGNPELNPWVEELRAKRLAEAEAQRQRQQADAEVARHRALQDVANAALTPSRRRRIGRR
jgi:hypothetical protein